MLVGDRIIWRNVPSFVAGDDDGGGGGAATGLRRVLDVKDQACSRPDVIWQEVRFSQLTNIIFSTWVSDSLSYLRFQPKT